MTQPTITPAELYRLRSEGEPVELIDVRTPAEFREVHVEFARNVPLDQVTRVATAPSEHGSPNSLYIICKSGSRARRAAEKLTHAGSERTVVVEGGTEAWVDAGLPVRRGKKAISLERQVRIAAGSLVVLGVVLAATMHPYFVALAGFVGAGLIFAGVTDTCGMGMVLARMPWNRASKEAKACSN